RASLHLPAFPTRRSSDLAACCGCATLPPPSGRTESTALRGTDDTRLGAVHAGYARWRKAVLEAGVTLYEYKPVAPTPRAGAAARSEEHTSELQSRENLVC